MRRLLIEQSFHPARSPKTADDKPRGVVLLGENMRRKFGDLSGMKFGHLTVLRKDRFPSHKGGRDTTIPGWLCRCDCPEATERMVLAHQLVDGLIKSCGCAQFENISQRITHGCSRGGGVSPEYSTWAAMKTRCLNPNTNCWERYGGRGITLDERWMSFENFLEDMGPKPSQKHSIDRIDNNKGYNKENCRWVTDEIQRMNKRNSVLLEYNGEKKGMHEWARELGINKGTIKSRLVYGWSVEDALTKPLKINQFK